MNKRRLRTQKIKRSIKRSIKKKVKKIKKIVKSLKKDVYKLDRKDKAKVGILATLTSIPALISPIPGSTAAAAALNTAYIRRLSKKKKRTKRGNKSRKGKKTKKVQRY
mgnify:CR=1 FL=1